MVDESPNREELYSMMDTLEEEVNRLATDIDKIDQEYDEKYALAVMRSDINDISELVDSMQELIGEGDEISTS